MNTINAIFRKQIDDLSKNASISLLYVLFPVVAILIKSIMDADAAEAQIGMFVAMFAGTIPMVAIANTVAEDREYKSLRFLITAGVKPWEYLAGLAGFVILACLVPLIVMLPMGGYSNDEMLRVFVVALLSLIAAALLGGTIGLFSKNVQQATALYTPAMLLLFFVPLLAAVNETVARFAGFLYPTQVLTIATETDGSLTKALLIVAANTVVLGALFAVAFRRKGLIGD